MGLYSKYQPVRPRKVLPPAFYWALIAAGAAVCVWIWRHSEKSSEQTAEPPEERHASLPKIAPPKKSQSLSRQPAFSVSTSSAPATNSPANNSRLPPVAPANDRILEAQIALARHSISPGPLDGVLGPQTRAALRAFQEKQKLPGTGELDDDTRAQLTASEALFTNYTVTAEDLARLHPLGTNWLSKAQQDRLEYEIILELVAEKSHAHPNLIRRLNRGIDWSNVDAGATLTIPNVGNPPIRTKAAFVKSFLSARILEAFDADTNLLAHFPCSIARRVEKRPVGELHVAVLAPNPNYTFDPENFPESAEARELGRKLILPPGPNNPVGTVWIGLDKPGYGIHGTPQPEEVGRTESHGCFRLANWNAEYLLQLVWVGMPVYVEQ